MGGLQVNLADAAELREDVLNVALAHAVRQVANIHTLYTDRHEGQALHNRLSSPQLYNYATPVAQAAHYVRALSRARAFGLDRRIRDGDVGSSTRGLSLKTGLLLRLWHCVYSFTTTAPAPAGCPSRTPHHTTCLDAPRTNDGHVRRKAFP